MDLQDSSIQGYKIYRDKTASVDNDRKATQQGVEVTAQSDTTGKYTVVNGGDEQGWIYTHPKDTDTRHNVGSYAQVYPAILRDSDSKIIPILDKSLAEDTNYAEKTQSTSPGDSSTMASVAETASTGTPGIVVGCLNHETQEQIFFPLGESRIKVDHKTEGNLSTKIYDVKADGTLDLTNVGTTKDFLYIEDDETNIRVESKFRMDATKKGPLDFKTTTLPSLDTPTESGNFEVKCVWNTDKWSWYAIAEKKETTFYARVRWNFTNTSDLSSGELVTYDPATDAFTASGTAIWIDWKRSAQCQFHTGGDSTIFIVKKILDDVTRSSVERDLYYCAQCFKDEGSELNAFYCNAVIAGNKLEVDCISLDLGTIQSGTNDVQTTIVDTAYTNKMLVKIPLDWNTESGTTGTYNYTEISDFGRGLPLLSKPIDPTMEDMDTNKYKMPDSTSYYERVD